MLIITGLGRCGTSFMAKFFSSMGHDIGDSSWNKDINAGMEHIDAVEANSSLSGRIKCIGTKRENLLINRINNPIFKDPRMMDERVLERWWEQRQDFRLLICHRNFDSIYKSRMKHARSIWPTRDLEHTPLINAAIFGKCITKIIELRIPYEIIYFPRFLDEWEDVYNVLDRAGIKIDFRVGRKAFGKLVDKDKVHYNG